MSQNTKFFIQTPVFEGPFDLLLFFIERDEIDIYNIPIATITSKFLEYIEDLERRNLDIASEFILVAATLMRIKARSLLPRKPLDESGKEIDPRMELTQKLLEYKQYKELLGTLREMEDKMFSKFKRGNIQQSHNELIKSANVDAEWESLSLFKLANVFEKLLNKQFANKDEIIHQIVKYEYTIQDQQKVVLGILKRRNGQRADFEEIFENIDNRIQAIIHFLAILELVNAEKIKILSGDGFNQFWLQAA